MNGAMGSRPFWPSGNRTVPIAAPNLSFELQSGDHLKTDDARCIDHPAGKQAGSASGGVAGDFAKRRAAARRQAAYARRRRLGQIKVAVVVIAADLTRAGLARGLLNDAGPTREDLARVCSVILQEAMKKH